MMYLVVHRILPDVDFISPHVLFILTCPWLVEKAQFHRVKDGAVLGMEKEPVLGRVTGNGDHSLLRYRVLGGKSL